MPTTPETIIPSIGGRRIGALHNTALGSFYKIGIGWKNKNSKTKIIKQHYVYEMIKIYNWNNICKIKKQYIQN